MEEIYKVLPQKLSKMIIEKYLNENITEIRLRLNQNAILFIDNKEYILEYLVTRKDILELLSLVSNNSIYAIEDNLKCGYVTIRGGHRIGVCGELAIENGKVLSMKNINSLNIRVAHEKIGVSNKIMRYIISEKEIKNTLIVSSPGMGKTTLIRDIARNLSNGFESLDFKGVNVGIVDERGEIAASSLGDFGLDVGKRTDVITNVTKSKGMEMMIRSMGLKVIITDEIGAKEDIEAIKYAVSSGVKCIFTMHGKDFEDILRNKELADIIEEGIFENVIVLSDKNGIGTIEKIHKITFGRDYKEVAS
ncbi:MAG: stage III sporulation protein AA [Clostridia bacterium]|nr:stage III sporulation protein AA [Clostridia bacterium]